MCLGCNRCFGGRSFCLPPISTPLTQTAGDESISDRSTCDVPGEIRSHMASLRAHFLCIDWSFRRSVWRIRHEMELAGTGIQEKVPLAASYHRSYRTCWGHGSDLLPQYVSEDQYDGDDGNFISGM